MFSDKDINFVYDNERMALSPDLSVANFQVSMVGIEERTEYIASTQREHAPADQASG